MQPKNVTLKRIEHPINKAGEKKRRPRRVESETLHETALNILKQQEKPIRSINLQKKIEKKTGRQISNMTVFMDQLKKKIQR
ncbi:Rok-like winged helix domain-containing protein [Bacillus sonorensis]|uniref:Rok-like winged helix domain-containing protein n=1 Tax=Bacillus sonorensis TaxID=119858 RepID=UPI0021190CE2|nr:hypothetical protein [Bacillus sonorensis]